MFHYVNITSLCKLNVVKPVTSINAPFVCIHFVKITSQFLFDTTGSALECFVCPTFFSSCINWVQKHRHWFIQALTGKTRHRKKSHGNVTNNGVQTVTYTCQTHITNRACSEIHFNQMFLHYMKMPKTASIETKGS